MLPVDLAKRVREEFMALADEEFAIGQRRFFQHEVETWGVRTAVLKQVEREVAKELKRFTRGERYAFFELMWRDGKLESGGLVCHVCRKYAKEFGEAEFALFTKWLDQYCDNWALTDGVSTWLLAGCIANRPELRRKLMPWTRHKNRWRRRSAAVSLLQEGKKGRHTEDILAMADALIEDKDEMVQKGLGWLLKESYGKRPWEITGWLEENRARASRLTLRYAAEKMIGADRQRVLN